MLRLICAVLLLLTIPEARAQRGIPVTSPVASLALDTDPVLLQLVQSVDSNQILSSLSRLEAFRTRYSGTDSLASAKNWIVGKFQEYGYTDIVLHAFTWSGHTLYNVVVTKPGRRTPGKFVLLTSHYDSISEIPLTLAPGVNDNGSGVAIMLELARILAAKQLDVSVRFICFSAEEQGLIGSDAYVANVVVPQNHDIKLVINVDEVGGYRGYANTMIKVERDEDNNPPGNNQASAAFTDTLASLTRTYSSLATTITEAYGSDYMSFQDRGYVITGFYEGQESPHYHHSTDNVANIDPHYLCEVTKASLAGLAYFGGIQRKYLTIRHEPQGDTQDTSQSVQIEAGITASAPVSSAQITYRTNWTPANTESTMVQTSVHGDTVVYRGWVPKQPYGTEVSYFLRVSSLDSMLATFPQDTLVPVVFRVLPDTIAPRIVHTQLPNRSYRDAPFEIRAGLADTNGIADAEVIYRINGGPDTTVSLIQLSADMWRASLSGAFSPADSVEYRIRARDRSFSGNLALLPASGWFKFRILNSLVYDFEASNGSFVPSDDWEWGLIGTTDVPAPPHGPHVWATRLAGNYSSNVVSTLLSPSIDLTGKTDVVFTFNHFYNIEPLNDGGNVAVSVDSSPFQVLIPQSGYPTTYIGALGGPGYSGNSFTWKDATFNIQDLSNHQVRFRFMFASDILTSQRGWYLDDVRIDFLDSVATGIESKDATLPTLTKLFQNYPNPFNPTTKIRFEIGLPGFVNLSVYDILGKEVALLCNEVLKAGRYESTFNVSDLPSGVYFYRLAVGSLVETRKLMILR